MWGTEGDVAYTLSFTQLSSGTNYNQYGLAHDITVSTKNWTVIGNQSLGNYLGVGGKSITAAERTLTSTSAIGSTYIGEVRVNYSGISNKNYTTLTVDSAKLEVSSNSSYSAIVETVKKKSLGLSGSSSSSYFSFTPSSSDWEGGQYYRITIYCTTVTAAGKSADNCHFDITSVVFYEGSAGSDPTLTKSSSMTTLTYNSSGVPVAQSFTIGGSNLTADVTVTAPTDYEVCKTSDGTYTSSVTYGYSTVNAADQTVYIHLKSGLSSGEISSRNITIASTGAESKTIAVTGSVPYKITWLANESTYATTYVAIGGTIGTGFPSTPSSATYCTGMTFRGWKDGAITGTTDVEPTFISSTTAPGADKTYYAVFASGASGLVPDSIVINYATFGSNGYADTDFTVGDYTFARSQWGGQNSSDVQGKSSNSMYNKTAFPNYIKSIRFAGASGTGNFYIGTSSQPTTNETAVSSSTFNYTSSNAYTYVKFTSTSTLKFTSLTITYMVSGTVYSGFRTTCCDKVVDLSHSSLEHGDITFKVSDDEVSEVATCKSDVEVTMTIDPDDGYQLDAFSVTTGDGYIAAKSTSPTPVEDNNSSDAQDITLTFAKDADGDYEVNAIFSEMVVTAWTWTKHSDGSTVTSTPVDVYVGQKIQLDIAYTPDGVLSTHKASTYYSQTSNSTYIYNPTKASAYFTFTGKAAVASTTIALEHNDGPTKDINVRVLALPYVTFVDVIHGIAGDDFDVSAGSITSAGVVTAVLSGDAWTVTTTLKTPTHDDVDDPGSSYNTCERGHLHLVGWIDKEWVDDGHLDATHEQIAGATGYFYTPDADIDLVAKNGHTFYAVWGKEVTE